MAQVSAWGFHLLICICLECLSMFFCEGIFAISSRTLFWTLVSIEFLFLTGHLIVVDFYGGVT